MPTKLVARYLSKCSVVVEEVTIGYSESDDPEKAFTEFGGLISGLAAAGFFPVSETKLLPIDTIIELQIRST